MDKRIDLAIAAAFAAFGLFMIIHAGSIKLGMFKDPIGPRAFFYGCGAMMLAGGLYLAVQRLRHWKVYTGVLIPSEGTADEDGYPASGARAFGVVGVCVVYALLFNPLGYLFATPLFLVALLAVLGQRNWVGLGILSVSFTVIAYVVFAQVLNVRIPVGPLTDLFRELGWIYL